jgi:DNA-binding NarL/FixJ family response regulator
MVIVGPASEEGDDIVHDQSSSRPLDEITVMVVDDSPELVTALVAVLQADPRFVVVGTAGSPDEVDVPASRFPRLATVDVKMPAGGGFAATRRILEISPTTRVVALSAFSTASLRDRMREAGAVAYLTKGMMGEELLDQLAAIAESGATAT